MYEFLILIHVVLNKSITGYLVCRIYSNRLDADVSRVSRPLIDDVQIISTETLFLALCKENSLKPRDFIDIYKEIAGKIWNVI